MTTILTLTTNQNETVDCQIKDEQLIIVLEEFIDKYVFEQKETVE